MRILFGIIGGRLFRGLYEFLNNRSFRSWLFFLCSKPLGKRYQRSSFRWNGAYFQVPDALSFFWQFHEIMVRKAYHFPSEKSNPVIFDCGSNVGLSLYAYRQQYPAARIVAFEPDPKVFELLEQNIERNKLQPVELHQAAVWTEQGNLQFHSEGADGGALGSGSLTVQTIDLKALLEQEQEVDFLKMDIEGAEHAVIPHIQPQLHKIRNLFIEFHSYQGQAQQLQHILEALSSSGFSYYLETDVRRKNPFIPRKTDGNGPEFQTNIFAVNLRP
jgi:FkbM family methyltransferase